MVVTAQQSPSLEAELDSAYDLIHLLTNDVVVKHFEPSG